MSHLWPICSFLVANLTPLLDFLFVYRLNKPLNNFNKNERGILKKNPLKLSLPQHKQALCAVKYTNVSFQANVIDDKFIVYRAKLN